MLFKKQVTTSLNFVISDVMLYLPKNIIRKQIHH